VGGVQQFLGNNRGVTSASQPFGVYVHVPYCASRCGYCDFNTYVPGEAARASVDRWQSAAVAEVRLARRELPNAGPVTTVFVGGGTPTLLPVADLAAVLSCVATEFGLTDDAEVTVEANPETITPGVLDDLLAGGVNRLSLGMQSADPGVLSVLDRHHTPGRAVEAARSAQLAGFDQVSLDLIYGTPGQTAESWRTTLRTAIDTGVGHVSAYALKVEPGTALHRRVARGEVRATDDDEAADAYEIAEGELAGAGLGWYEISNWARPGEECRHNLGYWRGADWWGVGPGAHSHVAGRRWWNERNPFTWIEALDRGVSPSAGGETLSDDERRTEFVMLRLRLAEGIALTPAQRATAAQLETEGLLDLSGDRATLTLSGRRIADAVTLRLLEPQAPGVAR
jgi:putative oxygen-independent coproporphyrinogen III oxidase